MSEVRPTWIPYEPPDAARPLIAIASRLIGAATDLRVPCLMMDGDRLTAQYERWQRYLPDVKLHYAVKVNADPIILETLASLGANFDAASAREMVALHRLGIDGQRTILSHPAKDAEAVAVMAKFRPWGFVTESEKEFAKLNAANIPTEDYNPVVLVRLRVTGKDVQQDLSAKFGRSDGKIVGILQAAQAAGFREFGIAFHVGTQCYRPDNYAAAIQRCLIIGREARSLGLNFQWIDIGGGICDETVALKHQTTHDAILAGMADAVALAHREGYRVIGEPGRYLVADAGTLVAQIISEVVSAETTRKLLINDGIYGGFSSQWNDGRPSQLYPFRLNTSGAPLVKTVTHCIIWGGTCDSIDRLESEIPYTMPINLDVGDYVMAPGSGAYTASAGSNFNGMPPPGVVLYSQRSGELTWKVSPTAKKLDLGAEFAGPVR